MSCSSSIVHKSTMHIEHALIASSDMLRMIKMFNHYMLFMIYSLQNHLSPVVLLREVSLKTPLLYHAI